MWRQLEHGFTWSPERLSFVPERLICGSTLLHVTLLVPRVSRRLLDSRDICVRVKSWSPPTFCSNGQQCFRINSAISLCLRGLAFPQSTLSEHVGGLQLDGTIKGSTLIQYRTSHVLTIWNHISINHPFLSLRGNALQMMYNFIQTLFFPPLEICVHALVLISITPPVTVLRDDMLQCDLISYIFCHSSVRFQTAVFWRMFQGSCDIWKVCADWRRCY